MKEFRQKLFKVFMSKYIRSVFHFDGYFYPQESEPEEKKSKMTRNKIHTEKKATRMKRSSALLKTESDVKVEDTNSKDPTESTISDGKSTKGKISSRSRDKKKSGEVTLPRRSCRKR